MTFPDAYREADMREQVKFENAYRKEQLILADIDEIVSDAALLSETINDYATSHDTWGTYDKLIQKIIAMPPTKKDSTNLNNACAALRQFAILAAKEKATKQVENKNPRLFY